MSHVSFSFLAQPLRSGKRLLFAGVLALALPACTTLNPATGKSEFTPFMSPAQEKKIGAENHPAVLAEHGGVYDDPELGGYVASVGGRLVAASEMPDEPFTFTVLNSPLVNAFALPGGYIYVTRGILALFNDEAEMASVLGHEIGHVTARHTAKRYNQQMFAGLLGAGIGIFAKNEQVGQLFNYGSQLYLLSYSRDQEYQSDELGVRYTSRAGMNPYGAPDMLRALQAETELQDLISNRTGESRPPEFFSTHPNTQERAQRARAAARATGLAPQSRPRHRDRYLAAIDGMIYGDDPKQGLIRGRTFWHGELRFTFEAPEHYRLINSSEAVLIQGTGPVQGSVALFAGGPLKNRSLSSYLAALWKDLGADQPLQGLQETRVGGMPALTGWARGSMQNTPVIVRLMAIRYSAEQAYHFLMIIPENLYEAQEQGLRRMTYSFRKLSATEAGKYKPRRIKIVTVQQGDTAHSLSRRMAFEDYRLERFLVLNGLDRTTKLRAGQKVKLIVEE
tara:strand:- start:7511 stop:9031 length:1521 start_codon:yes stop_codon:yes gene_type:complete